jgi:predicted ribosome quality control (RQC) complex YloA/Tae2 family protein
MTDIKKNNYPIGSSKVRFDGLDVQAMVAYLHTTLMGRRIVNIYDGGGEIYILKLDGDTTTTNNISDESKKQFLLMESGIRFHSITNFVADTKMPTPFCMKLRKHLRGLRFENILQISTDRVVLFQFGVGQYKHCIILELYAKGNLILTDQDYVVLALLRSHAYNSSVGTNGGSAGTVDQNDTSSNHSVLVQVGQVYPVSYATSIATNNVSTSTTTATATAVPPLLTTALDAPATRQEQPPPSIPTTNGIATASTTQLPPKKSVLTMESVTEFNVWATQFIQNLVTVAKGGNATNVATSKKKKKPSNMTFTLKMILSQNHVDSDVVHYGPALIEHCIRVANLDPNQNVIMTLLDDPSKNGSTSSSSSSYTIVPTQDEFQRLQSVLRDEGSRIVSCLQDGASSVGYILYRPMHTKEPNATNTNGTDTDNSTDNTQILSTTKQQHPPSYDDKILLEFQPVLLQQHSTMLYIRYNSFATAVEEYFDHMLHQRNTIKAMNAEKNAIIKLEKVRLDQQERIESLYTQQDIYERQARTIQLHAEDVDKAILVINSALDSGMSWDQLEQVIAIEQRQNRNPIALLIHQLDLENDTIVMRLPTTVTNEWDIKEETSISTFDVRVHLRESAYANSNRLFAQYRLAKEKSIKTIEASTKALKAAEETAKRQLMDAQKRSRQIGGGNSLGKRKVAWYEKFHWFITTDNYLVLGGRDAHQNELLVKRYLRTGDAYLHADVHGASSCILRAKRRRIRRPINHGSDSNEGPTGGGTHIVPLSEQALREAGNFTICHSSAWTSRMITSAWWVESYQVSKTAPTGEYLTMGSFMIRGKKNFLPPTPLEMGLGILFRLGDDDSILRHKNERRDFLLLSNELDDMTVDGESNNDHPTGQFSHSVDVGKKDLNLEEIRGEILDVFDDTSQNSTEEPDEAAHLENGATACHSDADDDTGSDECKESNIENGEGNCIDQTTSADIPEDEEEEGESDDDVNADPQVDPRQPQKRGLSVRDRKMIKKYGSLEAAKKAIASNHKNQAVNHHVEVSDASVAGSSIPERQSTLKRGQKAKLKRAERKYIDQDEEDRKLAMLALQGGEKIKKSGRPPSKGKTNVSENQQKVAAETVALLVKDSSLVAKQLSDEVQSLLAECVTVANATEGEISIVRWDNFDADTIEQLLSLTPLDAQIVAAKRLLSLKQSTHIDNLSASLGGT